jgi:hypothetical protein
VRTRHLIVLLLALVVPPRSLLSICVSRPPLHPCGSFWKASAVFVGRVIRAVQSDGSCPENSICIPGHGFQFEVEEAFRGVNARTVTVWMWDDCGRTFNEGGRYLVFAEGNPPDGCRIAESGWASPLEEAKPYLRFLREARAGRARGLIAGRVSEYHRDNAERSLVTRALGGVPIIVRGPNGETRVATHKDGSFLLEGLVSGRYGVQARLPGYQGSLASEVEVGDESCGLVDLKATRLSRLSGQLVDADGAPVPGVKVRVVPEAQVESDRRDELPEAYADKGGRFLFTYLSPGGYKLAVNPLGPPSDSEPPYMPTFFPGVAGLREARILSVAPAQETAVGKFVLSGELVERRVQGTLVWPDGQPVGPRGGTVLVHAWDGRQNLGYGVGNEGRFSLRAYQGLRYFVCGNAEDRYRAYGAYSDPIEVIPGPDTQPLTVTVKENNPNCVDRAKTLVR